MRTPLQNYRVVTALMAAIILYGSLYPFHFRIPADGIGPMATLLGSWAQLSSRGDILSNILLYMPLGFFAVLAGRAGRPGGTRLLRALLLGTVLCIAIELIQYYDQGRETSASDVYSNVLGTALGGIGGLVIGGDVRWPLLRECSAAPVPTLLLAGYLGYRLFPYVPTIDLHKYWDALKPIVLTPSLAPYDLWRHTVTWLVVATLVEAIARERRSRFLFPVLVGLILFAKILTLGQLLSVAETLGGAVAFLLWLVLLQCNARLRSGMMALLLAALIVAQRLEPFAFTETMRPFGWIPFRSLMQGSMEVNVLSFLEKFFRYGALVWLLGELGVRIAPAAFIGAMLLLLTSLAEMFLPGRSAEITDAVMVLVIAAVIGLIETGAAARRSSAPVQAAASRGPARSRAG
jgi:VanZ family protein